MPAPLCAAHLPTGLFEVFFLKKRAALKIYNYLRTRLLGKNTLPQTSLSHRDVDVGAIGDTIQQALAAAGLDRQADQKTGVADTIQALTAAGANRRAVAGQSRKIDRPKNGRNQATSGFEPACPGTFASRQYTNSAGTRTYKIYVPASYADAPGEAVALIVMLHGCTQSPDDFAAGTRMNALSEQHGFLVVYPAQATAANGSKCWNWFRSADQSRDRGEPSLIAGITRDVMSKYRVDQSRVFVSGLSAGAAMAVILGVTYPELYAAVGAHSGLPYRAAHDVPSAFGAMKGDASVSGVHCSWAGMSDPRPPSPRVPTIVFHGDSDRTVHCGNSAAIVKQAAVECADEPQLRASRYKGAEAPGRTYDRTVYADAADHAVVEQWMVHGAGHAWSGGSPNGSFTDVNGPDASAEMIRFFYSQRPAVAC